MFVAILLLLLMTVGGFAVTFFYDEDAPFLTRVCAGIVIGQIVFSLAGFVFGSIVGMSANLVWLSAVVAAFPAVFLTRKDFKQKARQDFSEFFGAGKNFFSKPEIEKAVFASFFLCLLVLLWFFFERAMLDIGGGIGTGNIHNTGDISFHLQAIYGFLDGQNLPPQNPSLAGSKFTYPFLADLETAMLAAAGARISEAMFWQNMFLIVALIVLMRYFTLKLTGSRFAANIAPLILLLSGGFGFILFFNDALKSELGIFGFLMKMPQDYTIRSEKALRWGNTLTVLYMNQRSILMGMPLALIVLTQAWKVFSDAETRRRGDAETGNRDSQNVSASPRLRVSASAVVGLLAGTLPLVHAHSFAAVMAATGFLALLSWRRWREWAAFFVGAAAVAVPELLWVTRNSATKAGAFVDWHFGWDNVENYNIAFFWLLNTGLFIPLLLAAIGFLIYSIFKSRNSESDGEESEIRNPKSEIRNLLLFWLPFAAFFVLCNVVRLAPWSWDNIKVLVYWFAVSIPLVAWLLAQIWERGGQVGKAAAAILVLVLCLSGFLDVWRIATRQMEYQVFNRNAVELARQARKNLPPHAVVASAPVHDSPAALMGRRWFLGFSGHVWSHGVDPAPRENILRQIYFGDDETDAIVRENGIEYLVVSPQERSFTVVNEAFLRRYPVVAQAGEYRLIKVR